MRRGVVLLFSLAGLAHFACGRDEVLEAGNGASSGTDASTAGSSGAPTGGAGGAGGSVAAGGGAGSGGTAGATCGTCGNARATSACAAKVQACNEDPACPLIRACVYGDTPGCSFGAFGAQCVETCIQTHCTSDAVARAFLEAELCAYCSGGCELPCASYCEGFTLTPDSATCPNVPDAAADQESEASDAEIDGSTDASAE
jgi:hypothetical protein